MNRLCRTGTRLSVAGIGALLLACTSSPPPVIATVLTTAVVVVPEDFLGTLPCSTDPGAMQTFRATLVDVTDGLHEDSPEVRSTVISCRRGAYFEGVTVGNQYIARIDGYERADLSVDLESEATVDPNGDTVEATWSTTCYGNEIPDSMGLGGENAGGAGGRGNDELGVTAYTQARVYVRACAPLTRTSGLGQTGAIVGIKNALGGLACGAEANQIDHFSVLSEGGMVLEGAGGAGGAEPGTDLSAPCSETVTLVDLEDGQNYTFEVVAFEAEADAPSWTTTCRMTARSGVLVQASCESLRPLD